MNVQLHERQMLPLTIKAAAYSSILMMGAVSSTGIMSAVFKWVLCTNTGHIIQKDGTCSLAKGGTQQACAICMELHTKDILCPMTPCISAKMYRTSTCCSIFWFALDLHVGFNKEVHSYA